MSNEPLALDEYLKRHSIEKGEEYSHTRIGDKSSKIAGGCYMIKNQEDLDWIETFVKRCCLDMAHDELLKPPSVDEQVEDFIKEFFENEESEALEQKDFLADFFDEVTESDDENSSENNTKKQETTEKDVVADHFDNSEEEDLEEKDFLSEFFAELESEDKKNN